jgi:hypothetical protein
VNGLRQTTSASEELSHHGVQREEALGLAWRFEAAQLSLPFPPRLVRELGAVVCISRRIVHRVRQGLPLGGRVASQLAGEEPAR